MNGQQIIAEKLKSAIRDAHHDIEKVELWATAIEAFASPVPGYVSHFERHGRWIGSDYPQGGPLERVLGFEH
jgi:hypothetical protein